MKLGELLGKMRRADKITVFQRNHRLFCGDVNKGRFALAGMMDEEVKNLHPELLDGLYIYMEGEKAG